MLKFPDIGQWNDLPRIRNKKAILFKFANPCTFDGLFFFIQRYDAQAIGLRRAIAQLTPFCLSHKKMRWFV